ncbi:hypothetical protein BW247_01620 [Acidihalobacter ferrooxydans]|uniref:Ubiquinone biosynthesis accessory factor UbiK n=1 Tax=Acidihalobacter ferrooxydans TaxID=1765967 RepID=A0A1P8UDS5_9GAMM|nr:hypothetical protein BW247_01620 [Acidihalobacter ferrooxydans]
MLDAKTLDELAAKLNGAIPESLRTMQHDIEKTVRAGVNGAMQRLDIVSREEFEVQSALLARTREKLDAMEARVHALEAKLGIAPPRCQHRTGRRRSHRGLTRRCLWHGSTPARSSASTRRKYASRCIWATACRASTLSACRKRRCARAKTGCAPRC